MKISVCTSGFKDWPIEKVLEWAHPLGFDGIELWMGHIERYQEEHGPLDKLYARLQEYGLEVPAISGYTTFSGGFSGEKDLKQEFKAMNRLLDVARQLKCPLIRTFVGHISSRRASPEQWGQIVRDVKKVMSMADQYGIDIAVEVHYDTFADNTESVQTLIREVDHPRLQLVFDGANLNVERIDQMDALPILYPLVKHVHLKNYKWDHSNWYKSTPVPIFEGDIDNRTLIKELERRGYPHYISFEYFGEKKEANIKGSLQNWNERQPAATECE
ncbi:sugar phosphate isomerase/epimerase family protein [Paenibacillus validus]|uniref:sugar phosphate isomerase/epimerase family protein n=1 Tax=Paenibacillus validus TaxID=44253 RepID=UPI003D2AA806